jgi:hypothetical protein
VNQFSPDRLVSQDDWSDLSQFKSPPTIDIERLHIHRLARLRACVEETGAAMCLLVNPVSLRYAVDYRAYALFQSHIPTAYLFVPVDGPVVIHGAIDENPGTIPFQSERLFEAVRGVGGTVRWLSLPFEGHGYKARESVEHVLWEQLQWFDAHVKGEN